MKSLNFQVYPQRHEQKVSRTKTAIKRLLIAMVLVFVLYIIYTKNKASYKASFRAIWTKFAMARTLRKMRAELENERQLQNLSNSEVMNIFVLTTFRSGSSFFGETINYHPEVFYHFEPLTFMNTAKIESEPGPDFVDAMYALKSLSSCHYEKIAGYLENRKKSWNFLLGNNKIYGPLSVRPDWSTPAFLNPACELYPVKLFKVTRLRGKAAGRLLSDFQNSRLIYLVRDPRGTWASRVRSGWCSPSIEPAASVSECMDTFCGWLEEDLNETRILSALHPDRVQIVKYEDLVMEPHKQFQKVFSKLGLSWSDTVSKYLEMHTKSKDNELYTLYRMSKNRAHSWKTELNQSVVQKLQIKCRKFMEQHGYPTFIGNVTMKR